MGLRSQDVYLVSFPRSGNTWVRFILCNYLILNELDIKEINDFKMLEDLTPAFGAYNLLRRWPYKSIPRFVKTHKPFNSFLSRPQNNIYIMRDPREIMVSYYHFMVARTHAPYRKDFSQFIHDTRYGLPACIKHYNSWRNHLILVLHYEKLKEQTYLFMRSIFSTLGISINEDTLKEAISLSSIEHMKLIEDKSGLAFPELSQSSFRSIGEGEKRQWQNYFSVNDHAFYHKICKESNFSFYQQ